MLANSAGLALGIRKATDEHATSDNLLAKASHTSQVGQLRQKQDECWDQIGEGERSNIRYTLIYLFIS